ncbi:hypothetical protein COM90_22570 [Bacillus thuringiensis]|uniref:Uncharacterized protein n=1 Tax=Bacillus thuringiensis TaxID=1428 RepID=A0AB36TQM1_BACTU|nr:hypothetical protein [Bacillus thuringiensis]PEE66209.1 hypothetical protein COM74_04280 [Bacillus thuringiensis]PEE86591.1 hypothetical protein COM90_22570 [Bacillus thuringiensis]PFM88074.1 hypothetical protein COJ61_22220 [Bacillus thuringiensis]
MVPWLGTKSQKGNKGDRFTILITKFKDETIFNAVVWLVILPLIYYKIFWMRILEMDLFVIIIKN